MRDHSNHVTSGKLADTPLFHTTMHGHSRYIKFKDDDNVEGYVKYCNTRRKRSLLAQFRKGILPIAIDTGRFKGMLRDIVYFVQP